MTTTRTIKDDFFHKKKEDRYNLDTEKYIDRKKRERIKKLW